MKYDPKGYAKMLDTQAELLVAMFEGMTAYEFEHSPKEVWEEMLKIPVGKMFGTMYACGHDIYMAMLFGAAGLFVERCEQLAGRVLLMF